MSSPPPTIARRKLLAAIAAGEDCSVAQIVVRTGVSGLAIETACERLEEVGLVTGCGPMARRRYRLSEAGAAWLAAGTRKLSSASPLAGNSKQVRAKARQIAWDAMRDLRQWTLSELFAAAPAYPSKKSTLETYVLVLVRAGIVVKGIRLPRPPGALGGSGEQIYALADTHHDAKIAPSYSTDIGRVHDPNTGITHNLNVVRGARPPRARPITAPTPHHPGA